MDEKRLFLWPVRRVLMAVTLSYLAGILLASVLKIPMEYIGILGAFSLFSGILCLRKRRSALLFVLAFMLLLGCGRAGYELDRRDLPTEPGVMVAGTIARIEKPYRVYLKDVTIDGRDAGYHRDAVVTLMLEDGAAEKTPGVGQRVSGKGRLFAPDEKRNPGGMDRRIQAICKGYELSGYLLPGWTAEGKKVVSVSLRQLRDAIKVRIEQLFGAQAPLFQGIMLGDRSDLDEEITAAMRLTGTAHILTVSGLHLSMIAGAVSTLLSRLLLRRKHRFVLLSVFLLLFTAITGAAAGTIRACIMMLLREWAKLRGRRYEPLTALSCAALCMTLVQPLWLLNASFQFSFFVVLSIQLFAGPLASLPARLLKAKGLLRWVFSLLAVSLSAQIGSIPMQLMLYGYVPLLSLPMNVLCSMLMPALLLGGWLTAAASLLSMEAGMVMARTLCGAASVFEAVSLSAASVRGALLRLPAPQGWIVLLILVLFMLLTSRIRYGRLRYPAALAALCLAAVGYAVRFDPAACYVQLDVGQGDGAIFRRGRHAVLVDVGPADSYEALRYLRHEGLYVDAVILSHLDEDHAGALGVLLASEIDVPAVITARDAAAQEVTQTVHEAFNALAERDIPLHEVRRGDHIAINGISLDVLSPDDALRGSNERSLLLYAQMEGVTFLLAGDLPSASEPESVPKADVLKVAHHGSKNSTSDAFARMASPEVAVISVGEGNWYGHPHQRVLDALAGTQLLRTDRDGCITLRMKDGAYSTERFLMPRNSQPALNIFTKIK